MTKQNKPKDYTFQSDITDKIDIDSNRSQAHAFLPESVVKSLMRDKPMYGAIDVPNYGKVVYINYEMNLPRNPLGYEHWMQEEYIKMVEMNPESDYMM